MGKRSRKIRARGYQVPGDQTADHAGSAPATAPAAPHPWDVMTPLERLAYMRSVLLEIESDVAYEVERARGEGESWHQIGMVFGITGEGARKRWTNRQ